MQLNIVETSTPETYDYLVYPEQHPGTYNYIANQFNEISSTLMESGKKLMEESKNLFERFYDSGIERVARAAARLTRNLVHPNAILEFRELEDIQAAAPMMQRYIMAEPYIREKYQQQLCSGYAGSYVDMEPGWIKEKHYDWRRIYSGIIQDPVGDDEEWVARIYCEDLRDGDRELAFDQKVAIIRTHEAVRVYAENGYDPTCPFGSKMG